MNGRSCRLARFVLQEPEHERRHAHQARASERVVDDVFKELGQLLGREPRQDGVEAHLHGVVGERRRKSGRAGDALYALHVDVQLALGRAQVNKRVAVLAARAAA